MKFKYSVFGDNTAENREWLKKIGYLGHIGDREWIVTDRLNGGADDTNEYMKVLRSLVCCVGNDNLFRAVSAMRDDSDYMQWFTCKTSKFTRSWYLCEEESYVPWAKKQKPFLNSLVLSSKATLEELQEHFKKYNYDKI